jgi:hypothetical protein
VLDLRTPRPQPEVLDLRTPRPQPEVLDLRTPRPQDVREPNPLELPDALADLQKAAEHFRDSTGYFAQVFVGPTEASVRFGIRACAEAINQIEPEGHA